MKVLYNINTLQLIRLGRLPSLIFFACIIISVLCVDSGCGAENSKAITIVYSGSRATVISIGSGALLQAGADGSKLRDTSYLNSYVFVRAEHSSINIIGTHIPGNNHLEFEPAIPFSPGKKFIIYVNERVAGEFKVPSPDASGAATVQSIYPTNDTVPENLLKIYISFSAPMREGEALRHIDLLNEQGDTIKDVFLDLQPELWNPERTVLTVWLDPGRIKRDLIPNMEKGKPLIAGNVYRLGVSNSWTDAGGLPLKQSFVRRFVVSARDSITPDADRWRILPPVNKSSDALILDFHESLDFFLAGESLTIMDSKNKIVDGRIKIANNEKGLAFYPTYPWQAGDYTIKVNAKLEDLAGNNLNRPFDNDALINKARNNDFYLLRFRVR